MATSARASAIGFPTFRASSCASSSARSSIPLATRRRAFARAPGVMSRHSGEARFARAIAASASSALARGSSASTSSVAGSSTCIVSVLSSVTLTVSSSSLALGLGVNDTLTRVREAVVDATSTRLFPPELDRSYPVVVRGDGVWLEDAAGKRYLDGMSGGSMAATLGYGRTDLVAPAREQALRLSYAH